jgi:hypothetical protein
MVVPTATPKGTPKVAVMPERSSEFEVIVTFPAPSELCTAQPIKSIEVAIPAGLGISENCEDEPGVMGAKAILRPYEQS